jgi:hypothetical protein
MLPQSCPNYKTVHWRFQQWCENDVIRAALTELANVLRARPEFYNSLTTDCTRNIWMLARVHPDRPPFSGKILVSGYLPKYLYQMGRIDSSLPFAQLQQRSIINSRARAADQAADCSQRIREPQP